MFNTYTIDTTTWTAVSRADLDPTVSNTSRVFFNGIDEHVKVKMLPITGTVPEDVVYQISTCNCDASGKALTNAQGQLTLTSPRRITCSAINQDVSLDAQLSAEVENELRLYGTLVATLQLQANVMENWAA